MRKIILVLSAALVLASCQKGILERAALNSNGIVAFAGASASGEISKFMETSEPITFNISSSKKMDKDVAVNFEVVRDTAVLAAFNESNGTNYWFLPEANYTLASKQTTIKAGNAVSETITMNVSIDGFVNGVIYCLPIKITGTNSGMTPIPGEEYAYIVIRGYVYASAAALPGGSYFDMPSTVSDPALHLDQCTMEIRFKMNSYVTSNPYISSLIGVEENFLLRVGDVGVNVATENKPKILNLAGQGVSIYATESPIELNKWYHVAVVADGIAQTCALYLNGELVHEEPMGSKGINLGQVYNSIFAIGMSEKGRYLNGYVSEASVWGRKLSQTEIVNNQCSIADPVKEARENKLLGYWKLDSQNKGKDLSGNGYDGNAHGSVSYTPANIRCPEE